MANRTVLDVSGRRRLAPRASRFQAAERPDMKVGQVVRNAHVVSINHIGAFVNIGAGKDGLIPYGFKQLKRGDIVDVKIIGINGLNGSTRISLKLLNIKHGLTLIDGKPLRESGVFIGNRTDPLGKTRLMRLEHTDQRVDLPERLLMPANFSERKIKIVRLGLFSGLSNNEIVCDSDFLAAAKELILAIRRKEVFHAKRELARLVPDDLPEELKTGKFGARVFSETPIDPGIKYFPEGVVVDEEYLFDTFKDEIVTGKFYFKLDIPGFEPDWSELDLALAMATQLLKARQEIISLTS